MQNKFKGILFLIISAVFFSCMNVFVKLSGNLPSIEKAMFRNLIASILTLIYIINKKIDITPAKKNIKLLLLRSGFGTVGLLANFYAVDHLIISDASAMSKTAPIFAIIFSIFILKEKPKGKEIWLVLIAFCGVLFIAQPVFSGANPYDYIIAATGGMFAGLVYPYIRLLSKNGVDRSLIIFAFSSFSTIICIPFVIANYVPMETYQLIYLLIVGTFATLAQFFMTTAYGYAPAKEISIYTYLQIIFASIFSIIIFKQTPDIHSFFGYALIISTGYLMFRFNKKTTPNEINTDKPQYLKD